MIRDALDRTLRLMRDEPLGDQPDEVLLEALTSTVVVLSADEATLRSHSARAALATTAQLAARSGARVFIRASECVLDRPLPLLRGERLLEGLFELGADLLPGCAIESGAPKRADVAVLFGPGALEGKADVSFGVTASDWSASLARSGPLARWEATDWPFGGLAAAALAASEIFKASIRKLTAAAKNSALHAELFAPAERAHYRLAEEGLVGARDLGPFDTISAGAIAQSFLYCLAQIPDVRGDARLIEPELSDLTNLNRYMLLRRSRIMTPKALDVAGQHLGGMKASATLERFSADSTAILPLRDRVLVGVDDIPSRWAVQAKWPHWLGVGATSHYSVLVSHHTSDLPCAGCLHPRDEAGGGAIPTAAFVSFWSGLLLASRFVRHVSNERLEPEEQQEYLATLRTEEGAWTSPVSPRGDCPVACSSGRKHAA